MVSKVDFSGRPFHFIGIGGIGMSALAYILAKRQFPVYGSDIKASHITKRLQENGAHIFWRQDASNIEFYTTNSLSEYNEAESDLGIKKNSQLPQVICSTAIQAANAEYKAALDLGCPIFHRSDLLAALIDDYQSIAVAGTHGKTTTSSLIGYMLWKAGVDPTIVVGGEVNAWEGNARQGSGPYLVAEADESDGSLVKLSAELGIITNIELDHPDHYATIEQVVDIFQKFKSNCKKIIGSIDCEIVREQLKPAISYSLNSSLNADYTADCIAYRSDGTTARVWERGQILGQLNLKLLGQHNLSNALAAVAVGRELGLSFEVIADAIATFEGARRRFEVRGERKGILFVDDYAHHPSEIKATLAAARLRVQDREVTGKSKLSSSKASGRVVAIFQPHRYSRTLTFLEDFAKAFEDADLVVLADIYSAGEPETPAINGPKVAAAIENYHPQVYYQPALKSVVGFLTESLLPGDIALFLGAGNLNQTIPEVMAFYEPASEGTAQMRHPA